METVKVIVDIPGLLEKGDILTSEGEGFDFKLFVKKDGYERSALIDYYSVCANIPTYFNWSIDEEDLFVEEPVHSFEVFRSEKEVKDRYEFFLDKAMKAKTWEESTVYHNLIWFIEWLKGEKELIKQF